MSQSSIADQVQEIEKAGFPVKSGARVFRSDSKEAGIKASDSWLHRWALHAAQNYAVISKGLGVRFLRGSCMGMPAVVIGIGPSLDLHYGTLKWLKGRAILIASDAAYNPLVANGIQPDLAISFDCKKEQSSLWKGMDTGETPMVFDSCAHPDVIASWDGPKLFFNHWHNTDEFSEKLLPYIYPALGQIPSAGTVGNMALQLANILGCGKIATVGMDFCYAKEGEGWRYRCKSYERRPSTVTEDGKIDVGGEWIEKPNTLLYDNSERVSRSFLKPMGSAKEPDVKTPDGSKELSYRSDPELAIYAKAFLNIWESLHLDLTHCSTWNIFQPWGVKGEKFNDWAEANCKEQFPKGRTTIWNLKEIMARPSHVSVSGSWA